MLYAPAETRHTVVIRRHRLPKPYRALLPLFILLPFPIFCIAILIGRGYTPALFDPRFWLPMLVGVVPAVYWWREGVDVLADGFVRRIHFPRRYRYHELADWTLFSRDGVLIVLDHDGRKALECRASLTEFDRLVDEIRRHVR
jgi:hypothetical protein